MVIIKQELIEEEFWKGLSLTRYIDQKVSAHTSEVILEPAVSALSPWEVALSALARICIHHIPTCFQNLTMGFVFF